MAVDPDVEVLLAEQDAKIVAQEARIAALENAPAGTAEAEQVAAFNAGDDYQIALAQKIRGKTYAEQPALFQILTDFLATQ